MDTHTAVRTEMPQASVGDGRAPMPARPGLVDASGGSDEHRTPLPLRRILVALDLVAVLVGWFVAASIAVAVTPQTLSPVNGGAMGLLVLSGGALLLSANGLYRRRICRIRSVELVRIAGVSFALGLGTFLLLLSVGLGAEAAALASIGGGASWLGLLTIERGVFREWIHGRRATGDFGAPVLVVAGDDGAAAKTAEFLDSNPVLGLEVKGVVGPTGTGGNGRRSVGIGDRTRLCGEIDRAGVSGVVLDAGSLTGDDLNDLVQLCSGANLHVHIASGLRGVDRRRVTVSPMADETFLHVAPQGLARWQVVLKRGLDVSLGTLALVVASPLLALSMAAVWLYDRGPIFFRQERVGHEGERFTLYKLRTMVVDADEHRGELLERNGRDGPLLKVARDPRITPVGRFLRASSLDELPQLLNVLEGSMSLVGPRPALPDEVEQFDEQLRARMTVKPGVTGLWQVEARDLPSFDMYRRFDLLYVQNWSLGLDLTIIARTITVVVVRTLKLLLPARVQRSAVPLE